MQAVLYISMVIYVVRLTVHLVDYQRFEYIWRKCVRVRFQP